MMKTLSVQEAKSFFLTMKPEYYLFSTENQGDGCVPNCLSAISRYTEAVFSELTNRVCFTQGNNMLCFSGVKYINVDETPSIGIIFDVVCTDANKSNADRIFTFIAD